MAFTLIAHTNSHTLCLENCMCVNRCLAWHQPFFMVSLGMCVFVCFDIPAALAYVYLLSHSPFYFVCSQSVLMKTVCIQ